MDVTHKAMQGGLEPDAATVTDRVWEAENWTRLQELFHLVESAPLAERTRVLDESSCNAVLRERVLALLRSVETPTAPVERGAPGEDGDTQVMRLGDRSGAEEDGDTRVIRVHSDVTPGEDGDTRVIEAGIPAHRASAPGVDYGRVPDPEFGKTLSSTPGAGRIGARVGPYALLRHLGSGGLGAVYLSERVVGGAVQQCALKLLSMHAAGASFEARFQREQQILATLNHPNITRLFDAGLSDAGQPYLVMEYVDGLELGQFCDDNKLSVRARAELFVHVCEAVSYAHRNLVVHLDLKPSNILVATDGTVKLLDFGTSKLIDPEGAITTTVMATPAYAAPEQLRGEAVTTACDVYSLGAVLYELLSGQRPFSSPSPVMALERAVKEQEPARITTAITKEGAEARGVPAERLRQLLDGDLASIVARCLRSRPRDRYGSVDALADDLKRHLDGRPVLARKQTWTYRSAKFVRRNALAVAAAIVVVALLVGSGTYAYMRQQQALREGERAMRMQSFLYRLIRLANHNYTGKPAATVPEFLQLGVKVLPDFIHNPADQRSAQLSLAESMFDNGDFEHAQPVFTDVIRNAQDAHDAPSEAEAEAFGGMNSAELGQMNLATQWTTHALSLANAPGVTASQRVWIRGFYVALRFNSGIRPEADRDLLRQSIAESNSSSVTDREREWIRANMAQMDGVAGRVDEGERLADEALMYARRQPYTQCDQADLMTTLGDLRTYQGDDVGSIPYYRQAVQGLTACEGADGINVLHNIAMMGSSMVKSGDGAGAIAVLEPTIPVWRRVGPKNPMFPAPLLVLAKGYVLVGQYDKAIPLVHEAQSIQQDQVKPVSTAQAVCHVVLAQAYAGAHREREALAEAQKAEEIYAALPSLSASASKYRAQNLALMKTLAEAK